MNNDRDGNHETDGKPHVDSTSDSSSEAELREEAAVVAGETDVPVGSVTGEFPLEKPPSRTEISQHRTHGGAFLVGSGILLSRIVGLLRQRVFAYYFGVSAAGDVYSAAFRIPNFLQNVFGEGALSASFIPVYALLRAKGEREEAEKVAGAVFSILALVTSVVVLVGVLAAAPLTGLLAAGFEGAKRELTVQLVRIFFPGAGLLVLSAWCLGVLNSHRRFFLSYAAPVVWNVAIIVALVIAGTPVRFTDPNDLATWGHVAVYAAWGAVVGSALQFSIQLPLVFKLLEGLRLSLRVGNDNVRAVIRNFFPVFVSRGVVQISAFVDEIIASFLGDGPMQALAYTQSLYTLPVSLFGMSVSAAELPAMSSAVGEQEEVAAQLRQRLNGGLRQIAFFIVASIVAILALGDVIVAALYRTGNFGHSDVVYVWAILAGSAVGLLPTTLGRLYSSTFYALHDTRTPFRYALVHVGLAIVLGYASAIYLPPALGVDPRWGAVCLTASAGIAGWAEFILLRRRLNRTIGWTGLGFSFVMKLCVAAVLSAGAAWLIKLVIGSIYPIILAAVVLTPYGLLYFALTSAWGIVEAQQVVNRFMRLVPGRWR